MIVSTISRDAAILDNIVSTLGQLKDGTVANKPLTLDHVANTCTVDFYVDAAKTQLLFSENSTDNAGSFSTDAGRTIYTPPDPRINFAPTISDIYSQPLYYVTAWFSDATTIEATYANSANLVFQKITVASKKNPPFVTNGNELIIVVCGQKEEGSKAADDYRTITVEFEMYLQLTIYDWKNLSEFNREMARMNVNNLIRDALYADRYREHNATLVNNNVDGTYVGQIQAMESKDTLRGMLNVRCAFLTFSTTY